MVGVLEGFLVIGVVVVVVRIIGLAVVVPRLSGDSSADGGTPLPAPDSNAAVPTGVYGADGVAPWGVPVGSAPDTAPPEWLDYEMWTGPAPMRPYNKMVHPRGWRAFSEYGNGIVGDMCIHMLDMVRWMMDLGWPNSVSSNGGILVDKASRANITDTQTATFDYGNVQVRWTHRTWGEGGDPKYPWSATFYGDKGTLKASVFGYDYTPQGGGNPVHKDVGMELDQYPEDQTEKDLEKHCAPAIRGHMRNLLQCRLSGSKPVADIEQGHISTASCVLANLSQQLGGRTLRWDPKTHTIVGDTEATRLLARPYRSPWSHPTAASV